MSHVLIIGGGFAGLNAAKRLGGAKDIEVTLIDRTNHHLFQPLLYQVAMAGLSPADIAAPIRSLLSRCRNISVLQGEVRSLDLVKKVAKSDFGDVAFDYLILACGARHIYYLTGFRNRLLVVLQWAWSYMTFRRGARLIVNKEWRFNTESKK